MTRRIFIINVGVNASHGSLRSPIFGDGTFEFLPIPESRDSKRGCPECGLLPRYLDLFRDKLRYLPRKSYSLRVHNDPEFETFTYGDYPTRIPRASNLRYIRKGDYLFFLARMVEWQNWSFSGAAGFYLVGFLDIENVVKEITGKPPPRIYHEIRNNAHMKRAEWDPVWYDRFWIFKGSKRSKRFRRAVPFTRRLVDRVLLDREGNGLVWDTKRSELQSIGSYTRACRMVEDRARINVFLSAVRGYL